MTRTFFAFLKVRVLKAIDPAATAAHVAQYHLLPVAFVPAAGAYLPWLEITCGSSLLAGRWLRGAWLLCLLLSLAFLAFTVSAWVRGIDLRCGCFGAAGSINYPGRMILVDMLLLMVSSRSLFTNLRQQTQSRKNDPSN